MGGGQSLVQFQLNTMPPSLKPERIFLLGMGEYVINDIKRYITYVQFDLSLVDPI